MVCLVPTDSIEKPHSDLKQAEICGMSVGGHGRDQVSVVCGVCAMVWWLQVGVKVVGLCQGVPGDVPGARGHGWEVYMEMYMGVMRLHEHGRTGAPEQKLRSRPVEHREASAYIRSARLPRLEQW